MSLPEGLNFLLPAEVDAVFNLKWRPIAQANQVPAKLPGNYMIAFSEKDLAGQTVNPDEVEYVGMSKRREGVGDRIKLFRSATERDAPHSGGKTLRRIYCNGIPLSRCNANKRLYFVVFTFDCDVVKATRTPSDLLEIGKVCLLEKELIAYIRFHTGNEPPCNTD